ncbi:MAG TPA: tRNA pseudouridine(38-40) synthase TruA [Firmicutes bacterium]|nr:tRNA pseudouridine(38-40) synthase TruA [Bacillota bacterium]
MEDGWRNIKLTVAYDGTAFHGFQRQPARVGRTVQGVLEERLGELTGERVSLLAAGRTDAGVHALGQVVNFKTRSRIPVGAWAKAMNAGLPRDVRVLAAEEVDHGFHARYDARGKVYRYVIQTGPVPAVLWRRYAYYVPHPLDVAAMREGGRALVGRHDFRSFQAAGSAVKTTVRTVHRLEWTERSLGAGDLVPDGLGGNPTLGGCAGLETVEAGGFGGGQLLVLTVEADGFLYNMVRIIVGLLVEVGLGRRPPADVVRVREAVDRNAAALTAPPHGLCLVAVKY